MKKIKCLSRMFLLALLLCFFASITVFAGEGNSLVIDSNHTGAPQKPYVFTDSLSYGFGDDTVNNGFFMPAANGSIKYVQFTATHSGYLIASYPSSYDYSYINIGDSNYEKPYRSGTDKFYFTKNQTVRLGFTCSSSQIYVNLQMHAHYKNSYNYTYEQYSSTQCKRIEACPCGYTGHTDAYSTSYVSHVFGSETTVAATCTTDSYKTKKCINCGYESKTTITGSKLGHNFAGTISQSGSSTYHKVKCTRCTATTDVAHSFVSNGTTKTCTACNYSTSVNSGGSSANTVTVVPGSVYATKLSSKVAAISVFVPHGASATELYFNNTLIGTFYGTTRFNYSKKGAAKGYYKVRSLFVINGVPQYTGFSAVAVPLKNVYVDATAGFYNPSTVTRYGTCTQKTQSLSFSGKKLKCTAWVYNNRLFKLKKVKIYYTLFVNGKRYAKTITKTVNVKPYGKKKITYYLGKGISDVRNGAMSRSVYVYGNWGFGWNR